MSEGVSSNLPSAGIISMGICESVGIGKCHLPFKPPSVGTAAPQDPAELLARARGEGNFGSSGMKSISSGSFLPGLPKMISSQRDANASRSSSLTATRVPASEGGRRLACSMSFGAPVLRTSAELPEPPGVPAIPLIAINKEVPQAQHQPSEKESAPTLRALNPENPSTLPSLGITIQPQLPLIEQHAKMRLQQQKEQPGMHLPVAGFEQAANASIRFMEEAREKQPLHPIFLDRSSSTPGSLPRFEASTSKVDMEQEIIKSTEELRTDGQTVLNLVMNSNDNILSSLQSSLTSAKQSSDPTAQPGITMQEKSTVPEAPAAILESFPQADARSIAMNSNTSSSTLVNARREANGPSSIEVLLQPSMSWKEIVEEKDDKSNKADAVSKNNMVHQNSIWDLPVQRSSVGVHVAWQDMKGDELFRYQMDYNKSGDERVNSERLGQLQQYIGSARQKQEKWKARVAGGTLFKKNQEKSFIEELFRWHDIGILTLHTLPEGSAAALGDGAKEGTDGNSQEEGETARKKACLADLRDDPLQSSGGDGAMRSLNGREGEEKSEQVRARRLSATAQKNVCPIASKNLCAHSPSNITGWSIISFERWDVERKKWFTNGNEVTYKQGSFNMCLRHMGFRPTKGARYGGTGYDWDNSVGFVFDPDVKSKYTSKRSRNYSQSR
mmetsp:Transcript_29178/g.93780  ORF Transcript_29178/g.93780 Transcript_29178/m.93780 type:complete len:671 (-) Transcript_29178:144-2156(-)